MRMKRLMVWSLWLIPLLFCACATKKVKVPKPPPLPPPPIEVKLLKRRIGEPPFRDHFFEIKITNRSDKPRWFIIRYNGEIPLRKDEIFSNDAPKIVPFVSTKLIPESDKGKGTAVQIFFKGRDKFYAYRLLPESSLTLGKVVQISQKDFTEFELWQAKGIYVNSKTPLEEWLPYNITSEKDAVIPLNASEFQVDLNRKGTIQRDDYPQEEVLHVWVMREDRWVVPIPPPAEP